MTRTIEIKDYNDFESNILSKGLKHYSYTKEKRTFLIAIDGPLTFTHTLSRQNQDKYNENLKAKSNQRFGDEVLSNPFSSKTIDGKKVFRRKHGMVKDCGPGNTFFEFVVPYNQVKINELEITNGVAGDAVDLIVYDTPQGHVQISMGVPPEHAVPSAPLNQFGFDVSVPNGFFHDQSSYDADLIKDMKIVVVYKNNGNSSVKNGANIDYHELK